MDFNSNPEIEEFRKEVRKFVQEEVEGAAMQIEKEDKIPDYIYKRSQELGLFGLNIPKEYGGHGLNMVDKCTIYEELGQTHNGFTTLIAAHTGIGTSGIVELGNEQQKKKYLPKMASGEWIGAFCLTEPEAGSNATNLKTTAQKKGDKYIINGMKHYITNGPIAGVYTVMAVTDPEKGAKGISSFIVERDTPGFRVGNIDDKMGMRGTYTSELIFDNVEVPEENLLGEENQGYVNALKVLSTGRAGLAARNLGSSVKLLDHCLDYVFTREQFGKPLFDQQVIQHKLADMTVEIEALRALTYRTAWQADQGKKVIKEASVVKLYGSEVYGRIADTAVQIFGGKGYMKEYPIERYYRDARIARIYEGTSEIQRNIIAAQLKKERFEK
ncbi:acyl-CoA dehydrogenase family protein [Alkalicoccus saliphilus]|uniref:Acyl-CoA dehydrogenase n=1 Tax=Alkalicoccus saliphilus TaxID=200989 RepID=A0A2T4U2Y8_9BACI|nr:acyl-CoA dehydrogenase family protein [Alkalicoccus saliphilus]PTL37763.1 acyl-CoA dehydrogenase [Alkalicoccus saliphilus]